MALRDLLPGRSIAFHAPPVTAPKPRRKAPPAVATTIGETLRSDGYTAALALAIQRQDISAVVALVRAREERRGRGFPTAEEEIHRRIADRRVGVHLRWTPRDRERILERCEAGDMYALGLFLDAMRADGTVFGIMSTRGALLGLPAIWSGDPWLMDCLRGRDPAFDADTGALLDYGHESDFQRLFPLEELQAVHWDGDLGGLGVGEFVAAPGGGLQLRHLDPHWVRHEPELRRLTYVTQTDEYTIRPGDGRWFVYQPYGRERWWGRAPWLACALPFISKQDAALDRLRWEKDLADALKVIYAEKDRYDDDIARLEAFVRDEWHRSPYVVLRGDEKADLVESNGLGFKVYTENEVSADKVIARTLAGQTMTSGDAPSWSTGNTLADIAASIVAFSASRLADTVRQQGLIPYARTRQRAPLIWVRWDVRSPERKAADAEAVGKYAEGIQKADAMLKSRGRRVDLEAYGDNQGFDLPTEELQQSDAPRTDLNLAPTSLDAIVTLRDAARSKGLPPPPGADPNATIAERKAELEAAPAQASAGIPVHETRLVHDLPIVIDRPAGTIQRGLGPDGPWEREYLVDYGYVEGTTASDGEGVDVYLGPQEEAPLAWVVEQRRQDGSFDELKVLLGFATRELAVGCYLLHVPSWCLGPTREYAADALAAVLRGVISPANDVAA